MAWTAQKRRRETGAETAIGEEKRTTEEDTAETDRGEDMMIGREGDITATTTINTVPGVETDTMIDRAGIDREVTTGGAERIPVGNEEGAILGIETESMTGGEDGDSKSIPRETPGCNNTLFPKTIHRE